MLFFERLLKYKVHRVRSKVSEPRNLIEWTFKREGSPYIACNERQAFFTSEDTNDINFGLAKTSVKP